MAGYRSLAAPWIGGAAGDPVAPNDAGVRSFLAPWIGGASGDPPVVAGGGYRSFLAFWMGGAANGNQRPPLIYPQYAYWNVESQSIEDDDEDALMVMGIL